jgi:hypothetical protein
MLKSKLIKYFEAPTQKLQCALSADKKHSVRKHPINLTCGHSLCKACLPKNFTTIKCEICNKVTDQYDIESVLFKNSSNSLQACLSIIFYTLEKEVFFQVPDVPVTKSIKYLILGCYYYLKFDCPKFSRLK